MNEPIYPSCDTVRCDQCNKWIDAADTYFELSVMQHKRGTFASLCGFACLRAALDRTEKLHPDLFAVGKIKS